MALEVIKRVFSQVAKEAPTGPYFGTIINAKEGNDQVGIYIEQEDESFIFSFYFFSGFIPEQEICNLLNEGTTKWVEKNNQAFERFGGTDSCFYLGDDEPLDGFPEDLFDGLEPGGGEWKTNHEQVVNKIISFLFD